jgi:hypothetical protein
MGIVSSPDINRGTHINISFDFSVSYNLKKVSFIFYFPLQYVRAFVLGSKTNYLCLSIRIFLCYSAPKSLHLYVSQIQYVVFLLDIAHNIL